MLKSIQTLFATLILSCLLLISNSIASETAPTKNATKQIIDNSNPYILTQQVAQQTFDRFYQDKKLIINDPNYLKQIVEQELMPYIDYRYAALKVMGRYVREATPKQRQDFVNAFEQYLVTTYAQVFTQYTTQKIEFEPVRDFKDEKQVLVNVQIIEPGRPDITVGFKLRRLKNNTWKAFDLVAEGVSLLRSKQTEIATLIRQDGIDNVIKMLDVKANDNIKAYTNKAA